MSANIFRENYPENGNMENEDVYNHRKTPPINSEPMPSLPQLRHWSEVVYECLDVQLDDWNIAGGSDYGQLPYLINSGDILLEVDGHKVSGFTRNDVLEIVRSKPLHDIKAVSSSSSFGLPIDLREYLSRRFVRGSIDQDLQATIRDNVYFRTIPCTTRPPRPSEVDGVDYKFVSKEVFMEMDKSGVLLESGVYSGHYYGTPLPLSTPSTPLVSMSMNFGENGIDPSLSSVAMASSAANPSSALAMKRRRNRSNIAAIDASSLPHGWEKISDAHYGVYYIDHINKRTQYERPYELELAKGANGFGFTLVELDKGLVVVKNVIPGGPAYVSGIIQPGDVLVSVSGVSVSGLQHSDIARLFATFSVGDRVKLTFARGYQLPPELSGEEQEYDYISLSLTKGVNGFGFTISDGDCGQKVKKILDLDRCGLMRQGDILKSINGIELLSMSHLQVVDVLKQCSIGDPTSVVVKRKKRFRSKTPVTLQSSEYYEKENNVPPRNCKTPNCEMMLRKDLEWMTNENNNYVNTSNHSNMSIVSNCEENYHNDLPPIAVSAANHMDYMYTGKIASQPSSLSSTSLRPSVQVDGTAALNLPQASPMATGSDVTTAVNEDEYEYYRISLSKGEAGFGFRIVGGAEEGRNVAIGSIVIGGIAHRDGILKAGDEIISINDRNVMGASHHHVVELMSQCGTTVSLLVRRKKDSDAFDVVLNRETNEGFGFVIISCGNCALIGRIIEGSPAQRCQRLRIKDRIIAVNGTDISNMGHPDIVQMIKESGNTLRLRIIPADCYTVELIRGPKGFGFSIRGGSEFNGMPLFILRIAADGTAYSLLNVGDEIIEINNISTVGITHAEAVQLISQSGPQVKLKLRRNASINAVVSESNFGYAPPPMTAANYGYYYNSYSAPNLMVPQTGPQVSPYRTNSSYIQ